jgi:hypothetical protein
VSWLTRRANAAIGRRAGTYLPARARFVRQTPNHELQGCRWLHLLHLQRIYSQSQL